MPNIKLSSLTLALLGGFCAHAAEYFVSPDGNDVWDGSSATFVSGTVGPKKTIQAAVDLADGNGTIVTLASGVYDYDTPTQNDNSNINLNRVVVKKSNVTIRSASGKPDDVHIVGHLDEDHPDDYGIGPKAVRCVASNKDMKGIVLAGLTLRDGACDSSVRGGGIYSAGNGYITLVDCVVSNCAAPRGGGIYNCTAHASKFFYNFASGGFGSAVGYSRIANCLVAYNYGAEPLGYIYGAVNCTVANNGTSSKAALNRSTSGTPSIYNMLVFGHPGGNGDSSSSTPLGCHDSVIVGKGNFTNTTDSANFVAADMKPCMAPMMNDWHPVAGISEIRRANAAHLLQVKLPEGYTYHDLDGNELPTTGTINAGAYQTVKTPAAARMDFNFGVVIDGAVWPGRSTGDWVYPAIWPQVYRMKSTSPNFYSIYDYTDYDTANKYYFYRIPLYDGWSRFMPSSDVAFAHDIRVTTASSHLYVDAVNGNDDYDGTASTWAGGESLTGPKKTLQAVVDAAPGDNKRTLVHVAPGVYDEGGSADSNGISNRVDIASGKIVGLRASAGPGTAVVKGAPDPTTGGCGPNAMRGAVLREKYAFMQGIDFTGCYTPEDASITEVSARRGAAYAGGSFCPQILDATISNNVGYVGVAVYCTALRCRFYDNCVESSYVLRNARLASCVFAGNVLPAPTSNVLGPNMTVFGSTFAVNRHAPWVTTSSTIVGAVTLENNPAYTPTPDEDDFDNCYGLDDMVYDIAARDFRLGALASAVGAVAVSDLAGTEFERFVMTDAYGHEPVFTAGAFDAGAVYSATPYPMYRVTATGGGVSIADDLPFVGPTENARTLTLTATDFGRRPFVGFSVNGEVQTPVSATLTLNLPAGMAAEVGVVYGTNWYVNATAADDTAGGGTPETALKTFMPVTNAVAGDVVHVAAGLYNVGSALHPTRFYSSSSFPEKPSIPSRVYLPAGVALVGAGAGETIIEGKAADVDEDGYGNGAGAIRCAALEEGASITGVTLTGGHTGYSAELSGNDWDDISAGGVLVRNNTSAEVRESVLDGNFAVRSAAGLNCRFVRCRLFNHTASTRSAMGRYNRYNSCIIDHTRGTRPIEHCKEFDSCTVGPDIKKLDGSGNESCFVYIIQPVINSLVLSPAVYSDTQPGYALLASNCVFCGTFSSNEKCIWTLENCLRTNLTALVVDEDYRPVPGANAAIDFADPELSTKDALNDTDISGAPRFTNGGRDAGALEAIWLGRYAADLGTKLTVAAADGYVRETETGAVRLPAGTEGAALACTLTEAKRYTLVVRVPEGTTLTATLDGETLATINGAPNDQILSFTPGVADSTLSFACSGAASAYADLLAIRRDRGMTVNFR
ncbi:MAG: hypothetical protein MJ240_09735 [Kiritimatiellae bacterium]|nr:hypothetical protein [Kiritimatiellia bacterium]